MFFKVINFCCEILSKQSDQKCIFNWNDHNTNASGKANTCVNFKLCHNLNNIEVTRFKISSLSWFDA